MADKIPTVERTADRGHLLRFPFDEGVNVQLKYLRGRWVPEKNAWWVADIHEKDAIKILTARFGEVMVLGQAGEPDYIMDKYGIATEQQSLF